MARPVETVSGDQQGIVGRGGQSLALAALCTLLFLTFLSPLSCTRPASSRRAPA